MAALLISLPLANLAWQVFRKPTELLFFADRTLVKPPATCRRGYLCARDTFGAVYVNIEPICNCLGDIKRVEPVQHGTPEQVAQFLTVTVTESNHLLEYARA